MTEALPFWKTKPLAELSREEWESLCDGCARCCLHKLEDEDTGEIAQTNVCCRLLDMEACSCTKYAERKRLVPDCQIMTPDNVSMLHWMPRTCAYRLLDQGADLPAWHPLVTGDPESVHRAGISVQGRLAGAEEEFTLDELLDRLVDWPKENNQP